MPPGFGAPWLKCCLFQATAKALRSPESLCPANLMVGAGFRAPVCGSTALVAVAKVPAENGVGANIEAAVPFPAASNGWAGCGWYRPVTRPPSAPGVRAFQVLSPQVESALATNGPSGRPPGWTTRSHDPAVTPPAAHSPARTRNSPTRGVPRSAMWPAAVADRWPRPQATPVNVTSPANEINNARCVLIASSFAGLRPTPTDRPILARREWRKKCRSSLSTPTVGSPSGRNDDDPASPTNGRGEKVTEVPIASGPMALRTRRRVRKDRCRRRQGGGGRRHHGPAGRADAHGVAVDALVVARTVGSAAPTA